MADNTTAKATKIVKTDAEFLAEREKDIRKKHRRVLPGTIRRESEGSHAGKISVEMKCQNNGCEATRRVATSDLFQVRFCADCTLLLRNKKRRAKVLAARKAAASAEGGTEASGTEGKPAKKARKAKEAKPSTPRKRKQDVPSFAASNGAAHARPDGEDTFHALPTPIGEIEGVETAAN